MAKKQPDTNIPQHEIEALARCLLPEIQKFFESPEGQKEFEEWKAQRAKETEKERSVSRYRRFCFSTQDILKIRSRPRLEPGSDYHYLVRLKGLEPTRIAAREPKSRMSTNSITGAYSIFPLC